VFLVRVASSRRTRCTPALAASLKLLSRRAERRTVL
jgi:hypothetical protein